MVRIEERVEGNRQLFGTAIAGALCALVVACGSSEDGNGGRINHGGSGGSGADSGSGGLFGGGDGGPGTGGGNGGGNGGGGAIPDGGCAALMYAQEGIGGPLDVYLVFDRTASMGEDCDFVAGMTPPTNSKACLATYALPEYLMSVDPTADTRLAFQFMSLAQDDCDGTLYSTPLVDLTSLPIDENHQIIQEISNEGFQGGIGTHIEGALRGIANYTANNQTEGREMIGVLMTDGDPNGCEQDVPTLSTIISDHLAATGIRTFIIGMNGATNANLEQYAVAGGADPHDDFCADVGPPCHYWNVGDGEGDAISDALQAIVQQVTPLPCEYEVGSLSPPVGEELDFDRVNVTLTDANDVVTTIGRVQNVGACPDGELAWYYDDPANPSNIALCGNACDLVSASEGGSRVNVIVGCNDTVIIR